MYNPSYPSFSFYDENSDLVDDNDDCIICKKLLKDHTEEENECYVTLVKKQQIKKKLSRKTLEGA